MHEWDTAINFHSRDLRTTSVNDQSIFSSIFSCGASFFLLLIRFSSLGNLNIEKNIRGEGVKFRKFFRFLPTIS